MKNEKGMTALNTSVGADERRSLETSTNDSIPDDGYENKSYADIELEMLRMMDPSYMKTVSMAELLDSVYISKPAIIEGLLYPEMYLFAGAPKLGKSFLMSQIAYHVSTGTPIWGYPVQQGTVLYLALEDDYRRLQERLYRMFGAADNSRLFLSTTAKQLGNGLDEQLVGFLKDHGDTSLIIIDTLQKVREMGGDSYSYASDYQLINRLKSFADSYGICLIVVHHTRKQRADDAFDMISGTNGLLGAADGGLLLQKDKRTSNTATLEIAGRDQQDQRLYLKRNEATLSWELDHVETELWKAPPEPILERIATVITDDRSEWHGSPTELCEFLEVDLKPNALTQKLNVNAGRLLQEHGIRYWNKRTHSGRQVGLRLEQSDDV